ncbi:OsmC family protein [Desulfotomaculum nigrificans CO-1-SRB]|uniref:OsmC family protein n=1 Tax=Desulfotomaculum nigrificans (strain DSM 14880 / VKM B-2319 / CO-1-SRB) TaxID=868595 RepID=F6B4E8_DESCC|nr:OsmC family protein [Desulfotomaculum nigrificans]AEF92971.1 OsmC family protein [Desulfotomaculum nigrificans CO-1-SRB]
MFKGTVTWQGGMCFEGISGSNHRVIMDTGKEIGGTDRGPRPTEMLLMALAGCSGIDVVHILEKMHLTIDEFSVAVEGDRAEVDPKFFTDIRLLYSLKGAQLTPDKVERAIRLSQEKYCSVANNLNKVSSIVFAFELNGQRFPEKGYLA